MYSYYYFDCLFGVLFGRLMVGVGFTFEGLVGWFVAWGCCFALVLGVRLGFFF